VASKARKFALKTALEGHAEAKTFSGRLVEDFCLVFLTCRVLFYLSMDNQSPEPTAVAAAVAIHAASLRWLSFFR
jgi:hypothetical protein